MKIESSSNTTPDNDALAILRFEMSFPPSMYLTFESLQLLLISKGVPVYYGTESAHKLHSLNKVIAGYYKEIHKKY